VSGLAMTDTEQEQPTHRFGVFELDLRRGELRKHGVRLKLQQQPLQVLKILLEHPGEVVTRDDIQKGLWPGDTYVDFDNAINSSIRKLREALGDSAESPRFIETLPRRGYRFIAPVLHPLSFSPVPAANGFVCLPSQADNHEKRKKARRVGWWPIASAIAGLLTVGAVLGFWLSHSDSNSNAVNTLLGATPFTSYPGYEVLPNFSPDGTRVAFSWQHPGASFPDVYIKLLGPGGPVRLSSAGGFGPAWSPDGRFLAFLRPVDALHTAVMVIPAVGGQEREVARTTFLASFFVVHRYGWAVPGPFLTWSPDGKWLLTLDQRSPGRSQPHAIARVSVESGEKQILTSPAPGTLGNGGLALAPDGKRLAFTQDSGFWARDIYVVPVSRDLLFSGRARRITFDNKAIGAVAWTSDGRNLVFSSFRDGKLELWKIAVEARSRPTRLNLTDDEIGDVAISRDGKHLLYSHELDDQNIWRVSLNDQHVTGPRNFIASTRRDTQGYYSPDGKRIVFESNRSGNEEIWICKADGSDPVQLTYFENAWAGSPKWSPDGRNIVFGSNAAGNWNIYAVSSGGGQPRRLTYNGADHSWPSWSRDGQWIYFFSNRDKQGQIWKMRANGGPEIQVTRNTGYRSDEAVDGKDLYYWNEQGLWKVPSSGGREVKVKGSYIFAPSKNGIYYTSNPESRLSTFELHFLDFRTQRTKMVGVLPGPLGWSIHISPDEHSIIYGKMDREGSELMLIENFQ